MLFAAVHESGNGTKRTYLLGLTMSVHWSKADITSKRQVFGF
jgi:hypothetical protein